MGKFVGADWASKRWVVASDTDGTVSVQTQPSAQAIWQCHRDADQILIDIPIGLPADAGSFPRPCDEEARDYVSPKKRSSIYDVPCRQAVQVSDYEEALRFNQSVLGDANLGPQMWGFAERIHEVDAFMRAVDTSGTIRESHPEVCFAALAPEGDVSSSKADEVGEKERLDIIEHHRASYAETVREVRSEVESRAAWKRRLGIGMIDDVIDAMALTLTARLGWNTDYQRFGGQSDAKGIPMEIVYHEVD